MNPGEMVVDIFLTLFACVTVLMLTWVVEVVDASDDDSKLIPSRIFFHSLHAYTMMRVS